MHRHATYSYSQPATTHRYSSTSSAFSASANPNEDWTKISDLAERRRIQNRIAQRNYRKKLKKRLEDLERRAASNSASPEQRPAELDRSATQARDEQQQPQQQPQRQEAPAMEPVEHQDHRRSAESYSYPYPSHPEDRGLFSHQYTHQLSTSPPPFSYSNYPTPESTTYAPYAPHTTYYSLPTTTTPELPVFSPYLPPLSSAYSNTLPSMVHPVKQEYYEEEISPFSMSYASMAGIDIPPPHSYQDSNPQTPPLSDSFDASAAGSPPESTVYPTTPASMPGTPPLHLLH